MTGLARQDLQTLSEKLRQGWLTSEALVAACLACRRCPNSRMRGEMT
jgi:hypothetical protein